MEVLPAQPRRDLGPRKTRKGTKWGALLFVTFRVFRGRLHPVQREEKGDRQQIEPDLHRHRRPPLHPVRVRNRPPRRRARAPQTASVQQTPHPPEHDPHRRDHRKPIARRLRITRHPFRHLHPRVAAEQRAEDRLPRRPDHPPVRRVPKHPSLRREIHHLRPQKRAHQRRDIDHQQPLIPLRQPRPKHEAHGDPREHQQRVGRGGHRARGRSPVREKVRDPSTPFRPRLSAAELRSG